MLVQNIVNDIGRGDRGQGGVRRWLPDDDVADDGGCKRVPGSDCAGEVKGSDDADNAVGMPLFTKPVKGPFAGDGLAIELAGKADGEVADVDHFLHFAPAFGRRLAHLERHQQTKAIHVLAQAVADLPHNFAALGRRHLRPHVKGLSRPFHQSVIIDFAGDISQPGAVDGRVNRVGATVTARAPLAVIQAGNLLIKAQVVEDLIRHGAEVGVKRHRSCQSPAFSAAMGYACCTWR